MTTSPEPLADDPRQSRLPGELGAVRDTETAHPTFTLPAADPDAFELTAEAGAGQTPSLFDQETERP